MKTLRELLDQYLVLRRALGVRLDRPGKALSDFVAFADGQGATVISTELALRWAQRPAHAQPATVAARLGHVRRFARHCRSFDPRTEIPPDGLLPYHPRRRNPYIWSDAEIRSLLVAAHGMRSPLGLRRFTYETLFGLIAAAGLRISEALHLDDVDVDHASGVLIVRDTKFSKTRYVPVHRSTQVALRRYARRRNRAVPARDPRPYFVTEHGSRLSESAVRWVFKRFRKLIPLGDPPGGRLPRIHDLRHTFAVRVLRRWYRTGCDVGALLPHLATYIGHAHVNDTYWYLTAVPDLLRSVLRRLESRRKEHDHEDPSES